jgi:hypothetical protein
MSTDKNAFATGDAAEKLEIDQHEAATGSRNSEFSPEEVKKIIRRVDARLVVTCGIMFCFSLMDRTNLGAAAIAGMTKEMELIQYRYVRKANYLVPSQC